MITTQSDWVNDKGDMSSLHNQHPSEEFTMPRIKENNSDASGEILGDISLSQKTKEEKSASPSKALEKASQSYQTLLEIKAIQDTNRWD